MREIVIVGFPKCGTSALIRRFAEEEDVHVLYAANGHVDALFPDRSNLPADKVIVHKCPTYILKRDYLLRLREMVGPADIVVCYRRLPRVLLSWHNMHRRIARTGVQPNHFVHREPEFWANCSVDDYYHKSAHRFRMDMFFDQLLRLFPDEQVTVVAQEKMARSVTNVVKLLKGEPEVEDEAEAHMGYADRADADIAPDVLEILEETYQRFLARVAASGVRSIT
ncbi:hypothetical protein [Acuticoccus yangtzensis]|uniref:hypothetical protein n=1 Tax=Acuticoccus yangtzensis TaxID=1443441 RepID=UPI0009497F00|nr:hypothetical protein [Acuticoccus yangtzensis]